MPPPEHCPGCHRRLYIPTELSEAETKEFLSSKAAVREPDTPAHEVRPVRYRKLRIAWSAAWGAVVVLLVALWVRSTATWDNFNISSYFVSNSLNGMVSCGVGRFECDESWGSRSCPAGESQKRAGMKSILGNNTIAGFGLSNQASRSIIAFPYWFVVAIATVGGTLPWVSPERYRFSVRTLLLATTLAAVGLGLIIYTTRG